MDWNLVPGFFEASDAEEYNRLANFIPDESLLIEVGSFNGRSLASISETIKNKNLKVWAIDLWETWSFGFLGSGKYKEADGWIDKENMLLKFCKTMMAFDLDPLVLCSTSERVGKSFANLCPHMVFIDADHSYEGCMKDIKTWWPLLPNGGILAGHDYDEKGISWQGVYLAVNEFFGNKFTHNGYIWSAQK